MTLEQILTHIKAAVLFQNTSTDPVAQNNEYRKAIRKIRKAIEENAEAFNQYHPLNDDGDIEQYLENRFGSSCVDAFLLRGNRIYIEKRDEIPEAVVLSVAGADEDPDPRTTCVTQFVRKMRNRDDIIETVKSFRKEYRHLVGQPVYFLAEDEFAISRIETVEDY